MNINYRKAVLCTLLVLALILCAFTVSTEGDKVAFFTRLEVPADVTINGSAVAIFGDVIVDGTVRSEAVAILGDVIVKGTVNGSVVSIGGTVDVKESGVLSGDAVGIGGGVKQAPGAVIRGEVADAKVANGLSRHNFFPTITTWSIIGLLLTYGFSWLILLIFPAKVDFMASHCFESMGRRFGIGIGSYLLFPVLIVALAISIIGIIVIPFFIIAFMLAAFIAAVSMKIALGRRIAASLQNSSAVYVHLLIGILIIFLLRFIPFIGWLANIFLSCIALGTLIDTRFGSREAGRQVQ